MYCYATIKYYFKKILKKAIYFPIYLKIAYLLSCYPLIIEDDGNISFTKIQYSVFLAKA